MDVSPPASEKEPSWGLLALARQRALSLAEIEADRLERAREYVARGTEHYERIQFEDALQLYERAWSLQPDSELLRTLVADTRRNLDRQRFLRRAILKTGRNEAEEVQGKYRLGCEEFRKKGYVRAREAFFEVWLLRGPYLETLDYLGRIARIRSGGLPNAAPMRADSEPAPGKTTAAGAGREAALEEEAGEGAKWYGKGWLWGRAGEDEAETEQPARAALEAVAQRPVEIEVEKPVEADTPPAAEMRIVAKAEPKTVAPPAKPRAEPQVAAPKAEPKAAPPKTEPKTAPEPEAKPAVDRNSEAAAKYRELKIARDLEEAKDSLRSDSFDQAIVLYEGVLKLDPKNKDALKGIERANEEAQERREKEERLRAEAAREALDKKVDVKLDQAKAAYKQDNFAQAIVIYEEALALDAENRAAQRGHEKAVEARNERNREMAETKEKEERRIAAAATERKTKAEQEAREQESAIRKRKIDSSLDAAREARRQGAFDEAVRLYDAVLAQDAENGKARDGREDALEEKAEAEEDAQERRIVAGLDAAREARKRGAFDEAVRLYDAILAQDAENGKARDGREDALEEKTEAAADGLGAKIAPLLADAHAAYKADEYAKSIDLYRKAIDLDANRTDALRGLERARDAQAEANRDILEARIEDGLDQASDAYKRDEFPRAAELYAAVLKLDAENRGALKGREKALAAQAEAEEEAKQAAARVKEKQAKEMAKASLKARETKIASTLDQAEEALDKKDFDKAIGLYKAVLALDVENRKATKGYSEAEEEKAEAAAEARKARLEQAAAHSEAGRQTAEEAAVNEQDRKRQVAKAQREAFEAAIAVRLKAAEEAYKIEDYARSIELYQAVLRMDSENRTAKSGCKRAVAAKAKTDRRTRADAADLRAADTERLQEESQTRAASTAKRQAFEKEIAKKLSAARESGDQAAYTRIIEIYQASLRSDGAPASVTADSTASREP